jgi:hypothetical protein
MGYPAMVSLFASASEFTQLAGHDAPEVDVGKDRGVQCVIIGDPNDIVPEPERAPAPVQVISLMHAPLPCQVQSTIELANPAL